MSFRLLLLAGLLAVASLATQAAPTTPPTPAGQVFAAWFAAFNSADPVRVRAFESTHGDGSGDVEQTLAFRSQTGGFELLRIDGSGPLALVALLKERDSDTVAELGLKVSDADPPKVVELSLRPAQGGPEPEPAPPRLSQDDALAALGARADALAATDRFAGAVLVARGNEVVLRRAWGRADREAGTPVTPQTRFRIGSMNKMFTAIATLQLVEDGKLSLDDPMVKHLPGYPNKALASRVTVRHLLTHSGGTGDVFGPEFDAHRLTLREPADYLALYGQRAGLHVPGTEHRYSSYGYVLLGAVIEAVSGRPYDGLLQDRIFGPAGMVDTGARPEVDDVPGRAKGYMRRDGAWVSNADTLPWRGTPAGGGYSTVDDLLRFARALQSGRLVSPTILAEATRAQGPADGYGYGFGVRGEGATRFYGHNGGAPGMNGDLRVFPALGVVVVALSNLDPPVATRLVDFYAQRMPGTP